MKKRGKKVSSQKSKEKTNKKIRIYWLSVFSFLFSIVGLLIFGFSEGYYYQYIWVFGGLIMLLIAPILGVAGLFRVAKEEDKQIKVFNDTLSGIGIIIGVLVLSIILIGIIFHLEKESVLI